MSDDRTRKDAGKHYAFGRLQGLTDTVSEVPGRASDGPASGPLFATVRFECGSADVTRIGHLDLSQVELAVWLADLELELGCVGAVAEDDIVLPGDLRARVVPVLEARGVRRVLVG